MPLWILCISIPVQLDPSFTNLTVMFPHPTPLSCVFAPQQQQQECDPGVVDPNTDLTLIRLKVWTYDPIHRMKYLAILVDGCKGERFQELGTGAAFPFG